MDQAARLLGIHVFSCQRFAVADRTGGGGFPGFRLISLTFTNAASNRQSHYTCFARVPASSVIIDQN